jgi:hypothetical protein
MRTKLKGLKHTAAEQEAMSAGWNTHDKHRISASRKNRKVYKAYILFLRW